MQSSSSCGHWEPAVPSPGSSSPRRLPSARQRWEHNAGLLLRCFPGLCCSCAVWMLVFKQAGITQEMATSTGPRRLVTWGHCA